MKPGVFRAAFLYLRLRFAFFWQKEIGAKAACKMLVKWSPKKVVCLTRVQLEGNLVQEKPDDFTPLTDDCQVKKGHSHLDPIEVTHVLKH